MEIPDRLRDDTIRFVKVKKGDKKPFENGWNQIDNLYTHDDPELIEWLAQDNNYGIATGYNHLVNIDIDRHYLSEGVQKGLPETFTVVTGSGKKHLWVYSNGSKSMVARNDKGEVILEVRGLSEGGKPMQTLAPGSMHPDTGKPYVVEKDVPIAFVPYEKLEKLIKKYNYNGSDDNSTTKKLEKQKPKKTGDPVFDRINEEVRIRMVLDHYGIQVTKNQRGSTPGRSFCPIHGGDSGTSFVFQDNVAYCHVCRRGFNSWTLVKAKEGKDSKEVREILCEIGNIELDQNSNHIVSGTSIWRQLAIDFQQRQPYFFDRAKIWWVWDSSRHCWQMVDEVDVMNGFDRHFYRESEKNQERISILEALKKIGRLHEPKPAKKTWIQFQGKIVDIKNWKSFEATPEYFVTNPVPWKLGESIEIPTIDRLFNEWVVGEGQDASYVRSLQEIAAYCLLPNYPLHRVLCLIGRGCNGKGTFIRFCEKLVGEGNYCASDLHLLSNNRFESAKLFRKLLCTIGEVDKGIFRKTSLLKRLTGQDTIGFEFKNKNPFDAKNYAKIVIATNTLPETTDKTDGFYRRWLIVDFPNTFSSERDILQTVPEEEYSNFAYKSIAVLKKLTNRGSFTNEGDIQLRKERYERRSNSIDTFINEFTEQDSQSCILFGEFYDKYKEYLQAGGFRMKSPIEVGRELSERGYRDKVTKEDGKSVRIRYGLRWRDGIL